MIEDYAKDLLKNGIIEAKTGNKDSARRYLDRALYMTDDHEAMAEGWYWMSRVTDDPVEKRKALENCLSHDLYHARARRALAILDGKLKPDEIVDPDKLPPAPDGLRQADAQRFMCPKCGGRMTFAPDGQALVCEYCMHNQTLTAPAGAAKEEDFIVAMATARGHDKPLAQQVFHCQGCGAEFILPPGVISANCVYCGSPHVVGLEKSKDLLAPDGIIPHAFDQQRAVQILVDWVKENKIEPEKKVEWPRGLYLPLWTFDIGGFVDYTGEIIDHDEVMFDRKEPKMIQVNDRYPVMVNDLPIPASRKLSAPFVRLISTFDLKAVKPYDPRYLANWPAEIYDVPMADSSLDAHSRVYSRVKDELMDRANLYKLISTSSAGLTIESFRLDLLPVWMTEIWFESKSHLVLINGQNGSVQGDTLTKASQPQGKLMEWLGELLEN